MILESLIGSITGGLFRLAPEVIKLLDRKAEREHELRQLAAEMEFAKQKAEFQAKQADTDMTLSELTAMTEALKGQADMAKAGGVWVAALSAAVRPLITFWFVGLYSLVKMSSLLLARAQGGEWKEVIVSSWGPDDMAVMSMILTFWFVGRVWERGRTH